MTITVTIRRCHKCHGRGYRCTPSENGRLVGGTPTCRYCQGMGETKRVFTTIRHANRLINELVRERVDHVIETEDAK